MQPVTDRPGAVEVGPLAPPPETRPTGDSAFAHGAMIATALALFPWSLVILFIAWLF